MNETENKVQEDEKKKGGSISGLFHKVTDLGKKAVEEVQKGARARSEKSKTDAYQKRIEKYKPVSLETFESEGFYMPNMVVIEDDVRRREVDVYEKAIGWISTEKGVEVFHLFEDSIDPRRFKFLPVLQCNAHYYVDNFDSKSFIKVDCIFARARDEKLAELKHIAHCLGAKSCSIEITESSSNAKETKTSVAVKKKGISASSANEKHEYSSGKIISIFEGSDKPRKPKLKWFANDENIKRLIEARCSESNSVKSEIIELKGATTAAMSQKTACAIDMVVGKASGKISMEKQAIVENTSILVFSIDF